MNSRSRNARVLRVTVGETLDQAGARAAATMKAIQAGRPVAPFFGAGFSEIGQMLAVFTHCCGHEVARADRGMHNRIG